MDHEQYYTAPPQKIFDEVKSASIKLWQTYDNEFGYVDEKVDRIKDIQNIRDNTCYMVSMFDHINQNKLLDLVEGETREWIEDLLFNNET